MAGGGVKAWGCPKCGCQESLVADSGRDEEGVPVRIRHCNNIKGCDGRWETEERVIASGSYWGRVGAQRLERDRARFDKQRKPKCQWCGGRYTYGSYNLHVRKSERHAKALKPPANGARRETVRDYQREWKRRQAA